MATNMLAATPAEAVNPVAAKMRSLISLARRVALASFFLLRVTSRYASSSDMVSTRSVYSKNIRADLLGDLLVFPEIGRNEQAVRAAPPRFGAGHARMDAELARLVVGGGRHRTAVGPAADDQGFAAQFGAVAHFHGGVEHVHVDVNDLAQRTGRNPCGEISTGSETCQCHARHESHGQAHENSLAKIAFFRYNAVSHCVRFR